MATMKLEGEIIIAANTLICTVGAAPVTIPLGRYFLTSIGSGGATRSLLAEFKFQLDALAVGTWTVSLADDSETATGKVTISKTSAAVAVTWNSTALRNVLGFTGNLASGTTWTGDNHAKYLHLPNCGRSQNLAPDTSTGASEADGTVAIAPDGTIYAVAYATRNFDTLHLLTLKGYKTWNTFDVVTNEAIQQFWSDVLANGLRFRFIPDRATDGTFRTWVADESGFKFQPEQVFEDWCAAESLFAVRWGVRETS